MKGHAFFLYLSLLSCLMLGLWIGMTSCSNPSKADRPEQHLATKFIEMIPVNVIGKCSRWTDDAVLCRISETVIMWCEAPAKAKPHCEIAADWTPKPPEAPKADASKTDGPKTSEPKRNTKP